MLKPALLCLLAVGLTWGQVPRIAVIDFYGLSKVPESSLRKALGVGEGDPLPASKGDAEARLERVSGVVLARLEAVCCEAAGAVLFVGIEEKGAPHFDLRSVPESSAELPKEILGAYQAFLDARENATRRGEPREDLTSGYALSADPTVRTCQEHFVDLAAKDFAALREALRNSADTEQRAVAAYIIGYSPDKQRAVDELQYALQDPEEAVRHNAMRSLTAIAVFAAKNPASQVRISATWLVEMLHSILWEDRTRAVALLLVLTENRDAEILELIRDRGLPQLAEMARWKSLVHALPAYILLGRTTGMTEEQVQDFWSRGDREAMIAKAAASAKQGK